jgi:signal transduction histidine kinase
LRLSERSSLAQLERELAYYRRECNDLGARLLRLQEEQSQAFREARRSRTVTKLIREAYRLGDLGSTPDEIGGPMLEVILENALCDRAAFLRLEETDAAGSATFRVTQGVGLGAGAVGGAVTLPVAPGFFFTTSRTPIEPPAYELTGILQVPYVLWCCDHAAGHALIIGNRSEGNVSRPFEPADQKLAEGALSVYIDVLLRKQAEVELRAAKAAAEEASAVRARFLATLSHELRTPLNAIIGFSEMMAPGSKYRLTLAQRQQYAAQILESGRTLLELINDILDYSSLAKVAPNLDLAWHGAGALLRGAVGEATALALRRGVAIELAPVDPGLELLVDRLRFRQVLNNLIGNALKFTPPGGRVVVGARAREDGAADVQVQDAGVGMRPEDIPRALEPFQQIGGGHSRAFSGTGLGLPIARGLAEAHGGALSIESAPGQGTLAMVLLPPGRARMRPVPAAEGCGAGSR